MTKLNNGLLEDLRHKLSVIEDAAARLRDTIETLEALEKYDSMIEVLGKSGSIDKQGVQISYISGIASNLNINNNYNNLSLLQRVLFVINKLKVAKVNDVYDELIKLDPNTKTTELKKRIRDYGRIWDEKGEITKKLVEGEVVYYSK